MRLYRGAHVGLVALVMALAACQAPASSYGGVRMGLGPVTSAAAPTGLPPGLMAPGADLVAPTVAPAPSGPGSMTVHLGKGLLASLPAQRHVLATVADISFVIVTVSPAGFAEVSQTIQANALFGGFGSATFDNLPAVATTVRITAYDAGGKPIGSGSQAVNVEAGAPTVVSFNVPLDPTYIQTQGSISANIGFQDGPTVVGTPPAGAKTPSGTILQTISVQYGPQQIAFDAGKTLWVPALNADTVFRYNASGSQLTATKLPVTAPATAVKPNAIAFDALGNAWTANYQGGTISSISAAGQLLTTVPIGLYPTSLAFDATGNLWVTNYFGNNVVKLNVLTGKPLGSFSTGANSNPLLIQFDRSGNPFVLNLKSQNILKLNPTTGAVVQTLKTNQAPNSMVFDGAGNLWVTNNGSNNLQKFDPAGNLLQTVATGQNPAGVVVDLSGNVWVANTHDNTVSKFNAQGVRQGLYPVGHGPRALSVDAGGSIWVAAFDDNKLQRLAP